MESEKKKRKFFESTVAKEIEELLSGEKKE